MITPEQKEQIKSQNKDKARRQDNKQHCQKILEGIGRFDDNTASRAVWELLQNARDLSDHAHVRIVLDENKLVFSHNGEPFNYDTFTSLIKQVSSEEKEDPNAAGQFGTGFMTTHKFSRMIQIDGCMKLTENEYAPIEGFKLDRTATEIQDMIDAMVSQLKYADDLVDQSTISEPTPETTFTYFLDADHFPAAKQGIDNAIELLPYVMTINDRIEQVEISGSKVETPVKMVKESQQLVDQDCNLYEVTICINDADRVKYYYLQSDDKKDIVILPLESISHVRELGDVPRFFIFFPLLGTQNFGLNFIFHSERFYPEEPRNAIVLPEDNVDKKTKYEANVSVLNDMTAMLFRYLDKYGDKLTDASGMAVVSIDNHESSHQLTSDFYKQLRQTYVNKMLSVPFITVNEEMVSASQTDKVRFLAPEIVEFLSTDEGAAFTDVVYDYAKAVSQLPEQSECLVWSRIVGEWDANDTGRFVTIKNIVDSITGNNKKDKLLQFLKFLKECDQLNNFASATIFPNREGELKSKQMLFDAADITDTLYNVAKPLIKADTDRFIDKDFAEICELPKYGRDDLKKSINEYVNSQKDQQEPFKDTMNALLDYCSVFPVQNGSSIRNNAMPYICELFDHPYTEQYQAPLPDVEADKEQNLYRNSFDVLVEYSLKQVETKAKDNTDWFSANKTLHYSLLNALSSRERTTTYQTESFVKYVIIPNQEGELRKVSELNVLAGAERMASNVKATLYDIYQKTYNATLGQKIVDDDYAWMCAFNELEPKKVCREINDALAEDGYTNPVVIEIIDKLDQEDENGVWKEWFKTIDDNKANIFLSRLKGAERASTYKFMKADALRKAKLLELIDHPDFDDLIMKAKEFIQNEHERHIVFTHMLSIGKEIEDKLRNALDESLLEVQYRREDEKMQVGDVQDGQDIIIRYKGDIIYYVEVKSKWNFNEPAHMSVNQMRQAVLNPDNYALCCVELSGYSSAMVETIPVQTILDHCYVHLDIGHKLSDLIEAIVKDDSDANTHIKIYDYRCDLNKGFFTSSSHRGIQPLVDAIINKVN